MEEIVDGADRDAEGGGQLRVRGAVRGGSSGGSNHLVSGGCEMGSSLLSLPESALIHVLQHTIVKGGGFARRARLVCKSLKGAVDAQVKSLVVDGPHINPSRFPFLQQITVALWQPHTTCMDLGGLIPYLASTPHLRTLTITTKAGEKETQAPATSHQQPQQQRQRQGLARVGYALRGMVLQGISLARRHLGPAQAGNNTPAAQHQGGAASFSEDSLPLFRISSKPSLAPGTLCVLMGVMSRCHRSSCPLGTIDLGPQPELCLDLYIHPSVIATVGELLAQLQEPPSSPSLPFPDPAYYAHHLPSSLGITSGGATVARHVLLYLHPSFSVDRPRCLQRMCAALLEPRRSIRLMELRLSLVANWTDGQQHSDPGQTFHSSIPPLATIASALWSSEPRGKGFLTPNAASYDLPATSFAANSSCSSMMSPSSAAAAAAAAAVHAASMSSKSSMLAPSSSLSILEETVSSRLSFDAPLAAHNTLGKPSSFRGLKRLDLNFTSSSGGTGFVKLNASSGWSALTAALAPSLKHLTLKSNSEGGLQIPHEGMAAIGKLNALQTLTIWIKDFIDEEALAHLKGLPCLTSLQVARLSISAAPHHLFPLSLPQVQTLSYYLARITAPAQNELSHMTSTPSASYASSVPLLRLFPAIHSATLRDWPMLTDPSFLGLPLEDTPALEGGGEGQHLTQQDQVQSWQHPTTRALSSSHPIQSLLLLQHTPLQSPLLPPPDELHPRTAGYMKPIRQLTSLKSLTFKHFTSPLHVRELCSLAAHLPNLASLTLEASAKACKVPRNWQPCNMFNGLTQLKSLSIDVPSKDSWDPVPELLMLQDIDPPCPNTLHRSISCHPTAPNRASSTSSHPEPWLSRDPSSCLTPILSPTPSTTPNLQVQELEARARISTPCFTRCFSGGGCDPGHGRGSQAELPETLHIPQPPHQRRQQDLRHTQAHRRRRTTSAVSLCARRSGTAHAALAAQQGARVEHHQRAPQGLQRCEQLQLLGRPLKDQHTAVRILQKLPMLKHFEIVGEGDKQEGASSSSAKGTSSHGKRKQQRLRVRENISGEDDLLALPECLGRPGLDVIVRRAPQS